MRRITLTVITISLTSLLLSSCKKKYICNCFNPGGTFKKHTIKETKKEAVKQCNAYSKEYQTFPFSETSCLLK